jgi:maltose alpha-D-glucosyltransferase/alpha-amylase
MQWAIGRNAGFSTAESQKLYLPIDPSPDRPSVECQDKDPDSLLNLVRGLCSLRRSSAALGPLGDFQSVYAKAKKYPFVYLRGKGEECYLIVVNPSGSDATAVFESPRPIGRFELAMGSGASIAVEGKRIRVLSKKASYGIFAHQSAAHRREDL